MSRTHAGVRIAPRLAMGALAALLLPASVSPLLEHPKVANVPAALDEVIEHFTDPQVPGGRGGRLVRMALRHSIFEQGGPAIGVMTVSTTTAPATSSTSTAAGASCRG